MIDFSGWGPALLQAAGLTLQTALLASFFGVIIGLVAAWARLSRFVWLRVASDAYATVVRATPQLLLILIIYFGGTRFLRSVAEIFQLTEGNVTMPPLVAGVTALAIVFGAYACEVFRGGFLAVPRGMVEAGTACGMTNWQIFRLIKAPQMLRFALPGLGNIWISIIKDTSLISLVGLEETMRVSELATMRTQQPMLFYSTAAMIYFALSLASGALLERAEARARQGERSA